jgi:4-diphosphocytidyl-2-C-methyl-D-erythritol kinase
MIVFPNAKINLGLNILSKRLDGYHEIETIFYPIGLADVLEFIVDDTIEKPQMTISGKDVPGDVSENLCLKVFKEFKHAFDLPNVRVHLHKVIPIGAGLGGGSADAAFLINSLNAHFNLHLDLKQRYKIAAAIGSDCAFFIKNTPAFAQGRGEILTDLDLLLKGYYCILLNPGIHIGTKEAYEGVVPRKPDVSLKDLISNTPMNNWRELVKNDFEKNIFLKYPLIKELKDSLYEQGAIYASMSGSGSSVYGIFNKPIIVDAQLQKYLVWEGLF